MPTTRTASYARIVATLKAVCEALIPNSRFISATWDQISMETMHITEPVLFGLNQGFQLRRENVQDNSERATIILDIAIKDDTDSDSEQQQNLLHSADIIANQLLDELEAVWIDNGIQVVNITKVPYYKKWGLLVSGVGLQMDLIVNTCLPWTWPDLSSYMQEISRNVDPFDWQGYTEQ